MPEPDLIESLRRSPERDRSPYLVTGSVAATLYGEPRATHVIDLVVELSAEHRDALPKVFPAEELYVPPPEVILEESRREGRGHFNIVHHASGLKADVYLVGSDELHAWAFRNARGYSIGGVEVRVAPPESVITRKLEFHREGSSRPTPGLGPGQGDRLARVGGLDHRYVWAGSLLTDTVVVRSIERARG